MSNIEVAQTQKSDKQLLQLKNSEINLTDPYSPSKESYENSTIFQYGEKL